MDVHAIATAIATRFSAAAVTPPTGYPDIALSTAGLPDAITSLPAVLVFPPSGQWTFTAGAARTGDLTFPVRFYYGPRADTARGAEAINKWHSVLIEQLIGQLALGQSLTGVTHCFVTASESGTLTYAEIDYLGIEFTVVVHLVEAIAPAQ